MVDAVGLSRLPHACGSLHKPRGRPASHALPRSTRTDEVRNQNPFCKSCQTEKAVRLTFKKTSTDRERRSITFDRWSTLCSVLNFSSPTIRACLKKSPAVIYALLKSIINTLVWSRGFSADLCTGFPPHAGYLKASGCSQHCSAVFDNSDPWDIQLAHWPCAWNSLRSHC